MNTCHLRDHEWYCDALAAEADRFAETVDGADPGTPVPTCPEWKLADLVLHVGGVHRWAGQMVRDTAQERLRFRDVERDLDKGDTADTAWIRAGVQRTLSWLRVADPDAEMWAWGADQHARFWSRRMVHETSIHRADADVAVGLEPVIDPDLAVDGIDEFLDNLAHAAYFAPAVRDLKGDGETLEWRSTDRGVRWRITLGSDGFGWDHPDDDDRVDVELEATAGDLVLFAYGRLAFDGRGAERFVARGDRSLLARWQQHSSI